jgi:hypothetical protein
MRPFPKRAAVRSTLVVSWDPYVVAPVPAMVTPDPDELGARQGRYDLDLGRWRRRGLRLVYDLAFDGNGTGSHVAAAERERAN